MTRLKTAMIIGAVIVGVMASGYGVYAAAHAYLGKESHQADAATDCGSKQGAVHKVTIQNGVATPDAIKAHRCDSLVVVNLDSQSRRLAFGEHDSHHAYNGVEGKVVGQNEQITVTLAETGEFLVHDHLEDSVHAHFTVTE